MKELKETGKIEPRKEVVHSAPRPGRFVPSHDWQRIPPGETRPAAHIEASRKLLCLQLNA